MARSDPAGPFIKLSSPETEEFWKVPVLFEDDALFAIEKPSGLLASPDRYDPNRPNLMKLLHRDIERGAPWAAERNLSYLSNAHRLDFETSGVFLLAKSKPVLVALADEFGGDTLRVLCGEADHNTVHRRNNMRQQFHHFDDADDLTRSDRLARLDEWRVSW